MEPEHDDTNPDPTDNSGSEDDNVQQSDNGPTERETLLESQLSALQSAAVSTAIEATGYLPRAVLAHTPLAELLGEDGNPDPDKVAAAATAAAAAFGLAHVPRTRTKPVTTLGLGQSAPPPQTTWAEVLRNR